MTFNPFKIRVPWIENRIPDEYYFNVMMDLDDKQFEKFLYDFNSPTTFKTRLIFITKMFNILVKFKKREVLSRWIYKL